MLCWLQEVFQWIALKFRGNRSLPAAFLFPRAPRFSDGGRAFTDKTALLPDAIVFLGDSMTYYANWSKEFPAVATSNQGIGGNTSRQVLARLAPIIKAKPKAIFLRIGINDLQNDMLQCEYAPVYKDIVAAIRSQVPGTKLFCMAVCPIGQPFAAYHIGIRERIQKYNDVIRSLSEIYGAVYIDDHVLLADGNGWLRTEYYADGLHLSPDGYRVVFEVVRRHLS